MNLRVDTKNLPKQADVNVTPLFNWVLLGELPQWLENAPGDCFRDTRTSTDPREARFCAIFQLHDDLNDYSAAEALKLRSALGELVHSARAYKNCGFFKYVGVEFIDKDGIRIDIKPLQDVLFVPEEHFGEHAKRPHADLGHNVISVEPDNVSLRPYRLKLGPCVVDGTVEALPYFDRSIDFENPDSDRNKKIPLSPSMEL